MSTYTKHVEQYMSTETVICKDGVEIARTVNDDAIFYDSLPEVYITEDYARKVLTRLAALKEES